MAPVRRHLSYANVAATLALVFSMSAGAVAGTHYLINSTKQINPKVLSKLKGRRGPVGRTGAPGLQGPPGAPGLQGPPGTPGPGTTAFNANSESNSLPYPLTPEQELTVASLSLPAGMFSVLGKLTVDDDPPSQESVATCKLVVGTATIDPGYYGQALGTAPNDRATIVLSGVGKLISPGTARIVCKTSSISGKYLNRVITAIQVGNLG